MKKVLSLVLAIAMVASFAVVASAARGPVHSNASNDWIAHSRCTPDVNEQVTNLCTALNNGSYPGSEPLTWMGETVTLKKGQDNTSALVALSSQMTKVSNITEANGNRVKQVWATCANAILAKELQAAAKDYNEGEAPAMEINHLTVFRQRSIEAAEEGVTLGDITLTAKNWQTGKKNATVVLAEVDDVWSIVGVSELGEKDCTATLPAGTTAYVVAMTW